MTLAVKTWIGVDPGGKDNFGLAILKADGSAPIRDPFHSRKSGRIAGKVINHRGDEVMKVFDVQEVVPK